MRRGLRSRLGWGCVGLTLMLGGCASPPMLSAIGPSARVALEVTSAAGVDGAIDIHNKAVGSDATKGGVVGGVAGGLYGFACGPFWFLCVPVTAMVGALPGSAAGAVVGASRALAPEKADPLRTRIAQWRQTHDLGAQLQAAIVEQARSRLTLASDDGADAQVHVTLQSLALNSTSDEQIALVAQVLVSVRQGTGPEAQKVYDYTGPSSHVLVWLDERGDFIGSSLESFSRQIGAQVVAELARR